MHNARVLPLLVLLAVPLATPQPIEADVPALRITELLAAPDGALGQREFIELHNPTNATVQIAGWRIEDAPTSSGAVNGYTFGDLALAPNKRIVVWSNGSPDARGPAWSTSSSKTVWNDAGDAATLFDPQGRVVDWFSYGSSNATPPPGFEGPQRPAAAAKGSSLALTGPTWEPGEPTPALAPGEQGGFASFDVDNVAPTATLAAPSSARPGETVQLNVGVHDGNGDDDVAGWSLRSGNRNLASGTRAMAVDVTAPDSSGPWLLTLTVTDRAGATATANATIEVRDARLGLALPDSGGLRFPRLQPGQRNVTSLDPFIVRNDGNDATTLRIDVAAFTGPGGAVAAEGNLWVGLDDGNHTTWTAYVRPLQTLADLPAGQQRTVWLRLDAVPAGLAAGAYGTSFTVVSA